MEVNGLIKNVWIGWENILITRTFVTGRDWWNNLLYELTTMIW